MEEIAVKLEEVIAEHVEFERPMDHRAPLVRDLGFDSLDLIETSFCIQEYFDFEFSDKNALDALDQALGGGVIIAEGRLTERGLAMVRERMPELDHISFPEDMSPAQLQQFYSLTSFARLIQEFLAAVPETCAESGETIHLNDMVPQTESGNKPTGLRNGDALLDDWVAKTAERMRAEA